MKPWVIKENGSLIEGRNLPANATGSPGMGFFLVAPKEVAHSWATLWTNRARVTFIFIHTPGG